MQCYKFVNGYWSLSKPVYADITPIHIDQTEKWAARGADKLFDSLDDAKAWWVWYNIPPEEPHDSQGDWAIIDKKNNKIVCRHTTMDSADRCKYRQEVMAKYGRNWVKLKVVRIGSRAPAVIN